MAGSGQALPPDSHQKVVLHPQVGGRASGTPSNAVDLTFPPLLNTFPLTPVQPEGNRTQRRTVGEALELLEDAGQIRQPDPGNSRLKEPAGTTNNKARTASGRSFASVIKSKALSRFPAIQLTPRQYGSKDGKPSISFTPAELQVGVDYLRYSLVAKFSGGRPHIEDIRKAFSTAYTLHGQSSIGAWDARHILIVLDSEEDARRVLAHPMRKVGHSLFRVFRWTKDFSTRREPTSTTTWIRLTNLPPELYNQGYIEPIISSFGRFLAMDNRTANFTNPSFARVCAEVDTSNELPDEVWISTGNASGFWQKLVFENRLDYCSKCNLHGHLLSNCRKMKQKQEEEKKIWAARAEHGLPTASSVVSVLKAAEDGDRSVPLGKGRTVQATEDKDVEWTVVHKRKGKQRSMLKEQRQQVSQDVNKKGKSSSRGEKEQAMAPQRITCHLKKSCSPGDLSKAGTSLKVLNPKNGPQNTDHLAKVPTKPGPGRESRPIKREDMDQVNVVNGRGNSMGEEIQEQGEDRRIEGKKSKVVKESKTKRRKKKSRLESLKKGCIEVLNDTEVDSPTTTPVKVVPKPIEVALNSSLRKEFEAFLKFARSVGVKTRVPGEVAMQILLSNLREKQGNDVVGRKGDCNQWRNSSIFVKRGERGES